MANFPDRELSNHIINVIKRGDGLYKHEGFLDSREVYMLRREMEQQFNKLSDGDEYSCDGTVTPNSYPFGKVCRIQNGNLNKFPAINSLFEMDWFPYMAQAFYGNGFRHIQVFFSHEYIPRAETKDVTRNSVLHFDPYQAFKFMIYITDCNKESGAFRYIQGSQVAGKACRRSYPMHELLNRSYELEANPGLDYSEDDVVYAEASSGSLLIFDTDIIHGGGILESKGSERMAIISHNRGS